jgi:hypothetical protein
MYHNINRNHQRTRSPKKPGIHSDSHGYTPILHFSRPLNTTEYSIVTTAGPDPNAPTRGLGHETGSNSSIVTPYLLLNTQHLVPASGSGWARGGEFRRGDTILDVNGYYLTHLSG